MSVHQINDHMAYTHSCGSVRFHLLRSGSVECANCNERLEITVNYETKTYTDGTTATGPAPLPAQSPAQQEHVIGLIEEYGEWMWDAGYMDEPKGEALVDGAADRRREIREAIEAAQQEAYAEGRKDEREAMLTVAFLRQEGQGTGPRSLVFTKPEPLPMREEALGVIYTPLFTRAALAQS